MGQKEDNKIVKYTIRVNGKLIDEMNNVSSIFVSRFLNRIGKAIFRFDTGGEEKSFTFPECDADTFKPGNKIECSAGYDAGKETLLFSGIIISMNVRVEGNIRPQLVVECKDAAFTATQGRKNKVYEKMTDFDVINKIMKENSLSVGSSTPAPGLPQHESLVQYYCTDWDFLRSRAEVNGWVIHMQQDKLIVRKPEVKASPVLKLSYIPDLISFNGTLSDADQYAKTEARCWDIKKQELIAVNASVPEVNQQGNISVSELAKKGGELLLDQTGAFISKEQLKIWADAQTQRNALSRIQGDLSFMGNSAVEPGSIIALDGMGKRFDGNVYVGGVEHTIEKGQWVTRVSMGLSPEVITDFPDVIAPPASGLLPGIEGLQIGKVKKIDMDPDKEYRILITLPLLKDTKDVWARLSTLYATSKSGSFFLPEKDDEVVVGFFNNDPCFPVILGSMFSSKLAAPYNPESKNDVKAFITRSQLKLEFDEEKKIITLTTPGKNSIEINDDGKKIRLYDQHKNEIVMESGGITLNSCKDINLKAKGNIVLDANGKAEYKSKMDTEISGMNVKVTAKMGASVKGSATAELSASGQTVVKGGIVMIN